MLPLVFVHARSVPFDMKALVKKELDNLKAQGIIESIAFSEWATPIVPVLKADKTSVRICGNWGEKISHLPVWPSIYLNN